MKKKRILMGLGAFAFLGLTLASCNGDKNFTVKFYNGSEELNSQEVKSGYNAEVPTAPTSDGKIFNGWYADSDLTKPFDFGSIIEQNTSVYAAWVNEYVVTFKDGSRQLSAQSVISGYNPKVPTAPAQTGKVFNGWYIDTLCTKPFDFGSVIKANVTVYAGWLNEYAVVFKDGNETLSSQSVRSGLTAGVPEAPTKEGERFNGWYKDELCTIPFDFGSQITAPTTVYAGWVNRHNVVFKDGDTTISTSNVFDNELVTAQTAENKLGYVFDGWCSDQELTQIFDFTTPITEPKTLYAKYTKKNYQYFAAKDNKTIAEDFSDFAFIDSFQPGATGFFNRVYANDISIAVADGKLVGTDSSKGTSVKVSGEIGFLYSGVVEGTMKYTPTNTANKLNGGWSIVQFGGYQDLTEEKTLFALRTNDNKKVQVYFTSECTEKVEDGETKTIYAYKGNAFEYKVDTEYEIYWKYDFASSKLSIKIDDTVIIEDYLVPEADRPVFLTNVLFITADKDDERGFKIDDFAVINEDNSTVDESKVTLKGIAEKVFAPYLTDANYSFIKPQVEEFMGELFTAIDATATKETAFNTLISGLSRLYSVPTNAQSKALFITYVEGVKSNMANNYVINKTAFDALFDAFIDNVNKAETPEQFAAATSEDAFNALQTEIGKIESDNKIRQSKSTEYYSYYQTKTEELSGLYTNNKISTTEYTDASNALITINKKYMGDVVEGETVPGLLFTCDITAINDTLNLGKKEINDVISFYSMTLDEYKAFLQNEFTDYKSLSLEQTEYTEKDDAILFSGINSMTLDLSSATTKSEASQSYSDRCEDVDKAISLYGVKCDYEANLKDLVKKLEASFKMTDYEGSQYETEFNELLNDILDDLFAATDPAGVETVALNGENSLEVKAQQIRLATEATVKFMNGLSEMLNLETQVVKGGKLERPNDPTQEGLLFKNWYTTAALETVFDFENTVINSDTVIYAAWYDTCSTYTNSTYDFKENLKASKDITSSKQYGIYTISKGTHSKFKEQNGYISLFIGNTIEFTVDYDGAVLMLSYYGNDSARNLTLTSTNSEYTPTKKYLTNLVAGGTKYTYDDKEITLESSSKGWIIFENLKAGSYTITFDTDKDGDTGVAGKGEQKIERIRLLQGGLTPVKSITASVTASADTVAVSNVKLVTVNNKEISITEGYEIEIRDSSNNTVENSNLSGTYTIYVKYGNYTVSIPYELNIA